MKVTDRSGPAVPGLRPAFICEPPDNQPATACTSAAMSLRNSTSHRPPSDGARLAVRRACQEGRDANRSLCAQRENAVILLFCYSGYRECRMMLRLGIDTANPASHSVR